MMENQENAKTDNFKETVNWFLHKNSIIELSGSKGDFCKSFVAEGTKLADGRDVSNYTFTFSPDRVHDIKAHDNSPDFIKDEKFQENFKSVEFFADWNLTLVEPYDKENPNRELNKVSVTAKELRDAQKAAFESRAKKQGQGKDKCMNRAKSVDSPSKSSQGIDSPDIGI